MSPEIEERFQSLDNAQALSLADYSGVYFLCKGSTIVYVGKAKNIARRVRSHVGVKDFDTFMTMRVPEEMLASVEMHWIQRLQPKLNCAAPEKRAYGLGMKPQMFRFPPGLIERLKQAATKTEMSKSSYVVMALEKQLRKDGIT
jgi:excinuclease UvrABC nuclease subunit